MQEALLAAGCRQSVTMFIRWQPLRKAPKSIYSARDVIYNGAAEAYRHEPASRLIEH